MEMNKMPRANQVVRPLERPSRIVVVLLGFGLGLGVSMTMAGCGGSVQTSPNPTPVDRPPPPITTDQGEIYNVTFNSSAGQVLVDKLEIEWNKRRGIHSFYGFYRDDYQEMATIPFRDLKRVDFLAPMPQDLFEQAIIGREDLNLRYHHTFTTRLTFWDGRQEEFYAIIPKFRGEKDLELWEFNMDNTFLSVAYIDFDR
jgi:hypothetical protein